MIKIVHTADLHFGLEHGRFPAISDKLREERLRALQLIVQRANTEQADAIVIAGDLFEKLTLPQKLVKEVKAVLAEFNSHVIIIPGNHDWYNALADENKLWTTFVNAPGSNIHFLSELAPFTCTLNEKDVVFYPCGCHQKHCDQNRIAWVQQLEKQADKIHIGIAHGNVDGYGLDEEGNYFEMSLQELKETGMDCWLLGHIHAPYPIGDTAGHEVFFFAGNHCAESWKNERTGGAWLIEIDDAKKVCASRWNHSGICFRDRIVFVSSLNDLQSVLSELRGIDPDQTVLRLTLRGSLTEEELQEAKMQINAMAETFLYAETIWNIGLKITSDAINKMYVKDTIPHTLLTNLSKSEEDQLARQLAYETIKNLSR